MMMMWRRWWWWWWWWWCDDDDGDDVTMIMMWRWWWWWCDDDDDVTMMMMWRLWWCDNDDGDDVTMMMVMMWRWWWCDDDDGDDHVDDHDANIMLMMMDTGEMVVFWAEDRCPDCCVFMFNSCVKSTLTSWYHFRTNIGPTVRTEITSRLLQFIDALPMAYLLTRRMRDSVGISCMLSHAMSLCLLRIST